MSSSAVDLLLLLLLLPLALALPDADADFDMLEDIEDAVFGLKSLSAGVLSALLLPREGVLAVEPGRPAGIVLGDTLEVDTRLLLLPVEADGRNPSFKMLDALIDGSPS